MSTEDIPGRRSRALSWDWIKIRYIIVMLLFLVNALCTATRVIMPVTIIAMLNNTVNPAYPEFNWDEKRYEGLVISSFYWGYSLVQIPFGLMVQMFGFKWPLLLGTTASSICVILFPTVATETGWLGACILRILQGVAQGFLFPSVYTAMAFWIPVQERGRLVNVAMCGNQFGVALALPVAGYLIPSPGGWPSAYYFFGGLGFIWPIFWYIFGANSPSEHPFIRAEERVRIQSTTSDKFSGRRKTPWKYILKCPSVWVLILNHCAYNFGSWTLLTLIPSFMNAILGYKIEENGVLSSLPYVTMGIFSFIFGWLSDYIYKKDLLSVEQSRKLFNTLGFWIPSFALLALCFVDKEHRVFAVLLLILAVSFGAGIFAGFGMGYLDLAPNYSGVLIGISNCVANLFSTTAMQLSERFIRQRKRSVVNWHIDFLIPAGVLLLANLLYVIVFTADLQPWNDPDYKPQNKD